MILDKCGNEAAAAPCKQVTKYRYSITIRWLFSFNISITVKFTEQLSCTQNVGFILSTTCDVNIFNANTYPVNYAEDVHRVCEVSVTRCEDNHGH